MKKKLITLCLTVLAALSLFALTACGDGNRTSETAGDISSFEETSLVESEAVSEVDSNAIASEPIESAEQPIEELMDTTANNSNTDNSTTYTPLSNDGGNSGGNTNAPALQPQNHAPIYKQQWVVDKAARSEEFPVWGNKEISVCNTCKADITGFSEQHLLDTKHEGYHPEVIPVQIDTKVIQYPEEGHWENVLVCEGCTGSH